jgi:hypothetical protein
LAKLLLGGAIVWGVDAAILASPDLMVLISRLVPKLPAGLVLLALGCGLVKFIHWRHRRGGQSGPSGHYWAENELLSFSCTVGIVILFQLPLLATWAEPPASLVSSYSRALGGILPFSDSANFYRAVLLMATDGELTKLASRRPAHSAFLAALLTLSNFDFDFMLLLRSALVGFTGAVFLGLLQVRYGFAAALAVGGLVLGFAYWAQPAIMSTPAGVFYGFCAATALLAGLILRNPLWLCAAAGLFLITFATRAGAYFLVPACLLIAGAIVYTDRKNLRAFVLLTLIAVVVGWAYPKAIVATYKGDSESFQGNFSFVLYQLAHGSDDWRQVIYDHPEFRTTKRPPAERYQFIYDKALEEIAENPEVIVLTSLRILGKAARDLPLTLMSEVTGLAGLSTFNRSMGGDLLVANIARGAFLAGLVTLFLLPGSLGLRLGLFVVVGSYYASLPFIWVQGTIRGHAAAFPLLALVFALPLAIPNYRNDADFLASISRPVSKLAWTGLLAATLFATAALAVPKLAGPGLFGIDKPARLKRITSAEGRLSYLALGPHIPFLRLVESDGTPAIRPDLGVEAYKSRFGDERLAVLQGYLEAVSDLDVGSQLSLVVDRRSRGRFFLASEPFCMPDRRWLFEAVTTRRDSPGEDRRFFRDLVELAPVGVSRDDFEAGRLPYGCLSAPAR